MNWSSAAIFLALLFTTACSQRGGRRYLPDQPLEESLAVDNHRFQTRSRGDVEDARRGDGRRARIQETTETNSRLIKGRSRVNIEETRQFHSRFGKEQESKPAENRQFASRRSLETEPTRQSSHERTGNERFRSRESSTIEDASKVKNSRGRTRVESTTVEYRTRGTETKRFPSRGTQEGEVSRNSKDLDHFNVGERPESRRRSQTIRKNVIEPPKNTEPVTEGFISRQSLREEIQRGGVKETTEKNTQNHHSIPITEGKVPDLTSASNEIEIEKRTRPLDPTVTEKLHSRQVGRKEIRRSRVDLSTENTIHSQRSGRKKTEELQTRGNGSESRRRSRPTDVSVTERFHSRQLSRDDYPPKRSRLNSSTEKIRSDNGNAHVARGRKGQKFTSRGSEAEFEKRRQSEISSTERFHSRESEREKLQSRIEPSTSPSTETEVSPELSNKETNTVDAENKIQTESVVSEPTAEANIDDIKPVTSQPDPLSTENTVDFPIKSNDVEEPNRTSRKLEVDIPERINQNHHRGQNHDFETSRRGRLESTLSRDRSRSQESPARGTEGRRPSRRFRTQSPDSSKETYDESKGRRTQQRLPSRTRNVDTPSERGRQKVDGEKRKISPRHRSESGVARSRNVERIPQTAQVTEPVTESRVENKVSIETQIQNEQKNEVTAAEPAETQVTSTQRVLSRNISHKPGNRGRGNVKGTNVQTEKEHSGEVKDEDNYPEVYKQLKKSGTDPKDILNPSQQPVFGSDEIKTPVLRGTTLRNSNLRSRDHKSEEINQKIESKITNDETKNSVSSTEKIERFSNFRSSRFKTPRTYNQKSDVPTTVKTTHELTTEEKLLQDEAPKEKKYNPYNYQEIRSFNRKKISNLPERSKNYRNTVKSFKNSDEQKLEEKNVNELHLTENQEPAVDKIKKSFTSPESTRFRNRFKNNINPSLKRGGIVSQNNVDEINNEETPRTERTRSFTGPGISRSRSPSKSNSHETKNNEDEDGLKQNDELKDTNEDENFEKERKLSSREEKESTPQSSLAKETSEKGRKFGLTAADNNKFRNKFSTRPQEKSDSESIKPLRRTSFTNPGISKFKSRKENDIETSSPESNTEKTKTRSNYIPRNREGDIRKFKARTEKTLEDVSIEPSINRNYNLFNRNEHSFRRRSFTSPASEGTEILTTIQYKNSMVAARTRPPFVPQRKKFVKTSTLDPMPISRFKARKASLSKLFNEEVLKEEDDLRPNIDDLSIDSLVSESEHSSLTTEISARRRPKYTESHIQKVPPKRRGSEYFKLASFSSTTSKTEVYTVLAVPYYDESTSAPETTISTEFVLDPTTHSTTLSDIIPSTTPISTTDFASTLYSTTEASSTSFSTTETPSTTTITTTETPQSSTSSSYTSELTTIKPTTTEPTSIKTTTDYIMTKTTTEPLTTSTTELITTIPTTSTIFPTTITTTITTTTKKPTTTTTKRPTTTTTTTKRPTTTTITTKRPTTTTTTTKRPTTTTTTTKRPTTTTKTTKRPATTTTTTTTKRPTKSSTSGSTKPTTRKTTVVSTTKSTTKKPSVTSTKVPITKKTTPKPTVRATILNSTEKPSSIPVTTHSTPISSTQKDSHLTTTFKIDELLSATHPNFLSTIAYLARNLTVTPTSYENANTANFRTPSIPTENTTPMQNQSAMKNDYFVYGLLPNNNVVRKVVKTTASPMDVPFYIYGLYPNGTIVRRFPNGTIVPDETEEENEVIGRIEPGSEESLETVVKKDNPLSYLYPPGHEKTTTKTTRVSSTTTIKQTESPSEVIPIDPRIAPISSIEKPVISIQDIASHSGPTTVKYTTKLTTAKPQTKSTTTKSTTKFTTTKPPTKSTTTKSTTKLTTKKPPTKSTTTKSTTKLTTTKPPTKSTTTKSTTKLTTVKPTMKQAIKQTSATTQKTSVKPATKAPVTKAVNIKLTTAKPTTKTTTKPLTSKPTSKPTSARPISKTTTSKPTPKTTSKPTVRATTTKPTPKTTVTKSTPKSTANKPTTKSPVTTIKLSSSPSTKSTMRTTPKPKTTTKIPVATNNKLITSTSKPPPKALTTKPNKKSQEKSTIKTITTPLSDAELLNNLLSQDVKEIIPKGTTESTVALADKVIQLAIERAQKSSTASPVLSPDDLQSLSTTSTPVQKQSLGGKLNGKSNKLSDETNTNKTGKISVWVIPPDESTTSKPNIGVSKSEAELLNALLSSPNTIENLSLSDQLLLADIISSTAAPQTTRKKKKKSRTTTTTTTPPPPAFPILQYLFGRNRGGGGGLFQRGLFRGGGLRNLESATPSPQNDGGIFQNDGLPQGQGELAAESQEDPQQGEGGPGLVSAAINVSRAVSQFMGFVIQGAAQSFQNYLQTRTRALANALAYPPAS
ncbi:unnamed protein product [Nezara viridula]|uniref:Uncharacterized protein n=1 Tax=Nezara viridula TaxID=85310 RepID=A0A9P0MJK0_NEZVI|nr:unnamed protein product [Nezara viridula]